MAVRTVIADGTFFPGADHVFRIPVVDDAGAPQTMTGWDLTFVIRRPNGAAVVTKTTAGGIALDDEDGTDDLAVVTVDQADTLGKMPAGGGYSWALWRSDDPNQTPLAYGPLHVTSVAGLP